MAGSTDKRWNHLCPVLIQLCRELDQLGLKLQQGEVVYIYDEGAENV
jgi:hypothetical protein